MSRHFWSIISIIGVTVWLVGAYALPGPLARLHTVLPGSGRALQLVVLVCFLLFVVVQVWLVWMTFAMRRAFTLSTSSPLTAPGLHLKLGAELFWTFLPLIMTLGLAWLGYQTWLSVPTV